MCRISDKIKFCTCSPIDNVEDMENYWVVYKFNKDKNEFILGEPMIPTAFRDPKFVLNETVILDRLNDGDAFDKPFKFNKYDRLEVVLKINPMDDSYCYNFLFGGRKWKAVEEDPFELMNQYDQEKEGEVKNYI
jgi:hypothetical protein